MDQGFSRGQWLLLGAVVIAAWVGIMYIPALDAPFVFDDYRAIVTNSAVQQNSIHALWQQQGTRFITYLTFAANVYFGNSLIGFHAVNVGIHIAVAWLVGYLVVRLFEQMHPNTKHDTTLHVPLPIVLGLGAGLLFGTHPLATQAVTYIVQRLTSLAALCYVAAIVLYLEGRWRNKGWLIAVSWVVAVGAMFTKEISFTLPIALVTAEMCLIARQKTKVFQQVNVILPFMVLCIIIPATLYFQRGTITSTPIAVEEAGSAMATTATVSSRDYFLTQLNVVRTYLRLAVLPKGQNIDYDYPSVAETPAISTILSAGVLLALLVAAIYTWRRAPVMAFGIALFFMALLVESTIFPLEDVIYEHRAYLPLTGLVIALMGVLARLPARWVQGSVALLLIIIGVFSVMTYQRNQIWASEISLGEDTVAKSPHKPRAFHSLGDAYVRAGDLESAQKAYEQAIVIDDGYAPALNNLGLLALDRDAAEAERYFRRALMAEPHLASAQANLGVVLARQGNDQQALEAYQRALELQPNLVTATYNLALLYARQGQIAQAITAVENILQTDPMHQPSLVLLKQLQD